MPARFRRPLTWAVAACLSFAGFMHPAQATVISTADLAAAAAPQAPSPAHTQLLAALARADVTAALQARGVDPAQVQARVAALSDEEAQLLQQQVDSAPAGASDLLGTLVFLFVLLLVTDILGLTKVFSFTRPIIHR